LHLQFSRRNRDLANDDLDLGRNTDYSANAALSEVKRVEIKKKKKNWASFRGNEARETAIFLELPRPDAGECV
jgi:hypothetical protein